MPGLLLCHSRTGEDVERGVDGGLDETVRFKDSGSKDR